MWQPKSGVASEGKVPVTREEAAESADYTAHIFAMMKTFMEAIDDKKL